MCTIRKFVVIFIARFASSVQELIARLLRQIKHYEGRYILMAINVEYLLLYCRQFALFFPY